MHCWGDKGVDWNGINDAAQYIHDYCVRWARLGGDYKEKFGTVRFYARFHCQLHDLIYPGYMWIVWPQFMNLVDLYFYATRVFDPVRSVINWWQAKVYRRAYKNAVKKWPHLRQEILCMADYDEFLNGL